MSFRGDDRAVSVTVTHALTLAITALLITGLALAAGDLLDRQQEDAARDELNDIGQSVTTELMHLKQLDSGRTDAVVVRSSYPNSVGGSTYNVHLVEEGGSAVIYLNSTDGVSVPIELDLGATTVKESTANGGELAMAYYGGNDTVRLWGAD